MSTMFHQYLSLLLLPLITKSQNAYPNRPVFHFVPVPLAFMNDPNGPFYDATTNKYHLFFQYHYQTTQWGHAISDDMLRWHNLPIAIPNNEPYNQHGVWTGSITQIPDGTGGHKIYAMYAVNTNNLICLAWPTDETDVNLTKWTNDPQNCIVNATRDNVAYGRDPTSSWTTDGGKTWQFFYTSYQTFITTDWKTWKQGPGKIFNGPGDECPDFYLLPKSQQINGVTHVAKVSTGGMDKWAFGIYNGTSYTFTAYNNSLFCDDCFFDRGQSWYASKSFYDGKNDRQVIYGWLREEEGANNNKWSGAQSIPRTITLLNASISPTGFPRIKTYPIKEFDSLRIESTAFTQPNLAVNAGTKVMFSTKKIAGNELDIELIWSEGGDCGVYVNGNGSVSDGLGTTFTKIGVNFDVDPMNIFYVEPYGQNAEYISIPGWNGNSSIKFRIIVDHSVVTVFVNDGIVAVTKRVYQNLDTYSIGVYANKVNCVLTSFNAWNVTHVIEPPPN